MKWLLKKRNKKSLNDIQFRTFPSTPKAGETHEFLKILEEDLQKRPIKENLGSLYTMTHPLTWEVYSEFIKFNPGYLGTWADDFNTTFDVTKLEYGVIHQVIDLMNASQTKISGYITTGGTEGNIFMMWVGRSMLRKANPLFGVAVLKTSLTHYSIRKASALCDLPEHLIPLDRKTWAMSAEGLSQIIDKVYKDGVRGFLLPLTLGYSSTGTRDNIDEILKTVRKIEKKYRDVSFFIWIDAALNGLIEPFTNDINNGKKIFSPFSSSKIQGIVLDFHKFGMVPYQAGVLLYRKSLQKYFDNSIDYLAERDTTLLGSRSGLPAIAIWTMINTLGKKGYESVVREQRKNKEFFVKGLKQISSEITVVTDPISLSCGVLFEFLKDGRLPIEIEKKYSLHPGKLPLFFMNDAEGSKKDGLGVVRQEKTVYKCFFLPHLKTTVIKEFLKDIASHVKKTAK